jgi:hypothetical protein
VPKKQVPIKRKDDVVQRYTVGTDAVAPQPSPAAPPRPRPVQVSPQRHVEQLLRRIGVARSPQARRMAERMFVTRLAGDSTVSPQVAARIRQAVADAERGATEEKRTSGQARMVDTSAEILFPTAATIEFSRDSFGATSVDRIVDNRGRTILKGLAMSLGKADNTKALESLLDGFHHEQLNDVAERHGAGWRWSVGSHTE